MNQTDQRLKKLIADFIEEKGGKANLNENINMGEINKDIGKFILSLEEAEKSDALLAMGCYKSEILKDKNQNAERAILEIKYISKKAFFIEKLLNTSVAKLKSDFRNKFYALNDIPYSEWKVIKSHQNRSERTNDFDSKSQLVKYYVGLGIEETAVSIDKISFLISNYKFDDKGNGIGYYLFDNKEFEAKVKLQDKGVYGVAFEADDDKNRYWVKGYGGRSNSKEFEIVYASIAEENAGENFAAIAILKEVHEDDWLVPSRFLKTLFPKLDNKIKTFSGQSISIEMIDFLKEAEVRLRSKGVTMQTQTKSGNQDASYNIWSGNAQDIPTTMTMGNTILNYDITIGITSTSQNGMSFTGFFSTEQEENITETWRIEGCGNKYDDDFADISYNIYFPDGTTARGSGMFEFYRDKNSFRNNRMKGGFTSQRKINDVNRSGVGVFNELIIIEKKKWAFRQVENKEKALEDIVYDITDVISVHAQRIQKEKENFKDIYTELIQNEKNRVR